MKMCLAIASVLLLVGVSCAEEPAAKKEDGFARAFPIVAVRKNASDAEKKLAKEVADLIGVPAITQTNHNPVCCVWLEVSNWTPNPGEPGYFILHQGGGTIISGSDIKELTAAVARFKKVARTTAKTTEFPLGMMTNYPVVTDK